MRHIIEQFPEEENEAFRTIGYTIGGMMIFPANRVQGRQTINGARGFNRRIADRFDLTLECIRRSYLLKESPLRGTLTAYQDFFNLFHDFEGYVRFFFLDDLVSGNFSAVNFFTPFDNFNTPSVPQTRDAYASYRQRSIEFVEARNCRIGRFSVGSAI